jgi:LPXTG-motif cell wall-anchored protein
MRFETMCVSNFKRAYRVSLQLLCVSLLSFALAPQLHADNWDKQTKLTFTEAVQIPGQILPAGTYVFRLLDSTSDRHIVQVFDGTGQKLITTVLAIPNYRLEPKGTTVVTFDERPSGTPEAIKAWFYPGDNFGQEFVYRKGESLQTAAIAMAPPAEVAQNTMPTEEPQPAVVETTPATATPEPTTPIADETPQAVPEQSATPAPQASTPPPEVTPAPTEPESLPKTGSELPLIGLAGLASLGSGLMVGSYRRRAS